MYISKLKKTLNESEKRDFEAYSLMTKYFRGNSNLTSIFDVGTASLLSDGFEES
jgi:hypothetical protein